MANRVVKVSLSLRNETLARVNALSKRLDQTRSWVADQLLTDALENAELVASATTDPVVMGAVVRAMSEPGVVRLLLGAMKADLSDEQFALFTRPPKLAGKRRGLSPKRDSK